MKLSMYALLFTIIASTASTVGTASACSRDGKDGFLPRNSRYIPVRRVVLDRNGNPIDGGITEQQFNDVLDGVEKMYTPIVTAMGGTFVIHREWQDGTVNAYADRNDGNWNITMFGGLARHKETTVDAFLLVACHELGHQIGGAPIKRGRGWPASEGQADYWATLKCARRILEKSPNLRLAHRLDAPAEVKQTCTNSFKDANEEALCERSSMAGKALARLLADLGGSKMPEFDTPDTSEVQTSDDNHPEAQCRLDTYYHGATCPVPFAKDTDMKDPTINTCSQEKGDKVGFRPRCWYAPGADNRTHHAMPNPHSRDPNRDY